MEKALDLLEVADSFWEKGDIENTINALDKAYALILDTNGDMAVARQKDDLTSSNFQTNIVRLFG